MMNQKRKYVRTKDRGPNKFKHTDALQRIWDWFVRPCAERFELKDNETRFKQGVELFFGIGAREVRLMEATNSFTLKGPMIMDNRSRKKKLNLVRGAGKRAVSPGDFLVVRTDTRTPNTVDVEYEMQSFVIYKPEWDVIKAYLKERA